MAQNVNPELEPDQWEWEQLEAQVKEIFPTTLSKDGFDLETVEAEEVTDAFVEDAIKAYEAREKEMGAEQLRQIERLVLLNVLDNRWREHLYEMDYLEEGIGLRAMGQKDPLVEFQREGFDMFIQMQDSIKEDFTRYVFHVEVVREDKNRRPTTQREERRRPQIAAGGAALPAQTGPSTANTSEDAAPVQARSDKIPRNAPCPCGSGKKYKMCHGRPGAEPLYADNLRRMADLTERLDSIETRLSQIKDYL